MINGHGDLDIEIEVSCFRLYKAGEGVVGGEQTIPGKAGSSTSIRWMGFYCYPNVVFSLLF